MKESQNILAILVLAISISLTMTTLPISVYSSSTDEDGRDNGGSPPDTDNGDTTDDGPPDTDNGDTDPPTENGSEDTDTEIPEDIPEDTDTPTEQDPVVCPDGREPIGEVCPPEEPEVPEPPVEPPIVCPDGREPVAGVCPLPVPPVIPPVECEDGRAPVDGVCPVPEPPIICEDGRDPVNGVCPEPIPVPPEPEPENGDTDTDIDIDIIIKNINKHDHNSIKSDSRTSDRDNFPDVDIIGMSIKDSGDAMYCLMNIDDDNIQCEEFEVSGDRVDQNIGKIIELDTDKEYDNGNTGSQDVDDAIKAVNDQDFDELEDLDNHEFDVEVASVGINPAGDGLTCILEDDSDEGKAFCESFTVSNSAVSGQITELIEMS